MPFDADEDRYSYAELWAQNKALRQINRALERENEELGRQNKELEGKHTEVLKLLMAGESLRQKVMIEAIMGRPKNLEVPEAGTT